MTAHGFRLSDVVDDLTPGVAWYRDTDGRAWLSGSRCTRCWALAYPCHEVCHRCGGGDTAPAAIGGTGVLYSWSTVHVSSARATPYTLGYVDLADGVRVLALIEGDAALRPGIDVRLTTDSADLTFEPAGGGSRER